MYTKRIKTLLTVSMLTLTMFTPIRVSATNIDQTTSVDEPTEAITSTNHDEINNCMVSFNATFPDKFMFDAYIDLLNNDTNDIYRLFALAKNKHVASVLYIPNGSYSILDCGIYGDTTNRYSLTVPDDFILEKEESKVLKTTLENYDEVVEEIKARENGQYLLDTLKDETKETTESPSKNSVLPWRIVTCNSKSNANVTVEGRSENKYDIIIKIVKDGAVNEAEYIYTIDGGQTWSTNQLLTKTVRPLVLPEETSSCGLTFTFPNDRVGDIYRKYFTGDTFSISTLPEPAVFDTTAKNGRMAAFLNGNTPKDYDIKVKIISSGSINTATFDYSLDNGKTYTGFSYPVSDSFSLKELPITLRFTDVEGEYVVNDIFSFHVYGIPNDTDNTIFFVGIALVLFIIATAGYIYLSRFKEKDSDYVITEYIPVEIVKTKHSK